jgi:hypothetical protein
MTTAAAPIKTTASAMLEWVAEHLKATAARQALVSANKLTRLTRGVIERHEALGSVPRPRPWFDLVPSRPKVNVGGQPLGIA